MILFAFAVWIYRLTLFIGIALLVYHFFIKLVGILLFAVEIIWFVWRPIWREMQEWRKLGSRIRRSRRALQSACLLAILLAGAAVPWKDTILLPGLLKAGETAPLFPALPGRLKDMHAREGATISAGDVLFLFERPELEHRRTQVAARLRAVEFEMAGAGFDPVLRQRSRVLAEEAERAQSELKALAAEQERLVVAAPFSGTIRDMSPDIAPGQWLPTSERLAILVASHPSSVTAYLAEDELPLLRPGAAATFRPEAAGRRELECSLAEIDRSASRTLAEPILGAPYGGPIPARLHDRTIVPEHAIYRARLTCPDALDGEQRGTIQIEAAPRSLLERLFRATAIVLVREWGL